MVFPDPPIFPCPRRARRHINVTTVLEASLPVICQLLCPRNHDVTDVTVQHFQPRPNCTTLLLFSELLQAKQEPRPVQVYNVYQS